MTELPLCVMWFDPGRTTGYAALYAGERFASNELSPRATAAFADVAARAFGPHLWLGWERYVVTQGGGRAGRPEHALEVIGVLRATCERHGVTMLQPAAAGTRVIATSDMLRRLGWYRPGRGHANDAACHLLAWALRARALPPELASRLLPLA